MEQLPSVNQAVDALSIPLVGLERQGLFVHQKKDSSEKQNLFIREIPDDLSLGNTINNGDCFFDACAQKLNEISGREEYTVKSLRLLCHEYAVELDKCCNTDPNHPDNWIAKAFNNPAKYQEYLANIRYTVEEREAGEGLGSDKLAPGEEQHMDRRVICARLGIKLHVIEVREYPDETHKSKKFEVSHNLSDQHRFNTVDKTDINWTDEKTIHIGECNFHFVPILKKTTIQKKPDNLLEIHKSQKLQAEDKLKPENKSQHAVDTLPIPLAESKLAPYPVEEKLELAVEPPPTPEARLGLLLKASRDIFVKCIKKYFPEIHAQIPPKKSGKFDDYIQLVLSYESESKYFIRTRMWSWWNGKPYELFQNLIHLYKLTTVLSLRWEALKSFRQMIGNPLFDIIASRPKRLKPPAKTQSNVNNIVNDNNQVVPLEILPQEEKSGAEENTQERLKEKFDLWKEIILVKLTELINFLDDLAAKKVSQSAEKETVLISLSGIIPTLEDKHAREVLYYTLTPLANTAATNDLVKNVQDKAINDIDIAIKDLAKDLKNALESSWKECLEVKNKIRAVITEEVVPAKKEVSVWKERYEQSEQKNLHTEVQLKQAREKLSAEERKNLTFFGKVEKGEITIARLEAELGAEKAKSSRLESRK